MSSPILKVSVTKTTEKKLTLDEDQLEKMLKQWARDEHGMTQPEVKLNYGYEYLREVVITQTDIEEETNL